MKKNITINLCGRLFQIDEDAYELLQHYIDSLRAAFGHRQEADEITNDIEARIAELFDELKASGTEAVTIDHVRDIITRIGKPEQLAGEEAGSEDGQETGHQDSAADRLHLHTRLKGRRLYRNPNDKMVAGVLSGLAAYTDSDVTPWRAGYLLLAVASLFLPVSLLGLILIYLIMAIALPEAKRPGQQLQMEGKEVTPASLADAVVDGERQQVRRRSLPGMILSFLLKMALGIIAAMAVVLCFFLCIGFLLIIVATVSALIMPAASDLPFSLGGMGLLDIYREHRELLFLLVAALLALLFITIYAIIHMLLSLARKTQPMSTAQRIVWIVLWVIALCIVVPTGTLIVDYQQEYLHQDWEKRNTHQGVFMEEFESHYLKTHGWKLLKHENCNDSYVRRDEHYTGEWGKEYLNAWNADCEQIYQAERQRTLPAGTYRVSCKARAQGRHAYIYATSTSTDGLHKAEIPAYGNTGGIIWEQARKTCDSIAAAEAASPDTIRSVQPGNDYQQLQAICQANNGKGFGWSPVEVVITLTKPGTLRYGLTTNPEQTGYANQAEWFSACDFSVEHIAPAPGKRRKSSSNR